MKSLQICQKNNLPPTAIIKFSRRRIGRRESAVRAIRSAVITIIGSRDPDERNLFPQWNIGDLQIALCRPNESPIPGRWNLDIWTPEKKVLNISWSPHDDLDLEILSFRRGNWEQGLTDKEGSLNDIPEGNAERKSERLPFTAKSKIISAPKLKPDASIVVTDNFMDKFGLWGKRINSTRKKG
jgi:hypothetical protein